MCFSNTISLFDCLISAVYEELSYISNTHPTQQMNIKRAMHQAYREYCVLLLMSFEAYMQNNPNPNIMMIVITNILNSIKYS